MNTVYILQSAKNGKYYIGSTNDLKRRLSEHNSGQTKSLKNIRPLTLVFRKEFATLSDARKIERKLKKLKSRNIMDTIVKDQEMRMGL